MGNKTSIEVVHNPSLGRFEMTISQGKELGATYVTETMMKDSKNFPRFCEEFMRRVIDVTRS